jgi:metal-responsive CopG/Arc/MetJ family transcriptional regulator
VSDKYDKVRKSLDITDKLNAKLRLLAEERGTTDSDVIREALRKFLREHEHELQEGVWFDSVRSK